MAGEITTPHNNLFRSVFGDTAEASALLRAHLPQAISRQLLWSTLALQPVGFIDSRLRDSESDLLYLIRRKTDAAPVWLYVLLVYIAATTTREPRHWQRFADAVRRRVPGGGELMNKTERMRQIYGDVREQEGRREGHQEGRRQGRKEGRRQGRQEGRMEGELRGKVLTIEALLGRDVPWATIHTATGIDQATFHRLKHQLEAADGSSPHHPN